MTEAWFGKSWGAPACDPETHVPTPVGEKCLRCQEPILDGHQGLGIWCVDKWAEGTVFATKRWWHLDCYLKMVIPHDEKCPHCRGVPIEKHAASCTMRSGGLCSCQPMPSGSPERGRGSSARTRRR